MTDDRVLGALRGHGTELEQVVALLAAAGVPDPASVPLGEGDRLLLGLHRAVLGRDLELAVTCPTCGEVSTAPLGVADVPPRPAPAGDGPREPTYGDLAGLPADPAAARAELLRRVGAASVEELDAVDTTLAGPLVVACAACGEVVAAPVDVQRLVVAALVRRLDDVDVEVHLLARAYQWDLASIEALPADRRSRLAALVAEGR